MVCLTVPSYAEGLKRLTYHEAPTVARTEDIGHALMRTPFSPGASDE